MNREIWERVRLREAKRGNHLMSYDMKVEVEGKVGLFAWLALDSLASPLLPICTHTGVREVDVGQKRDAGGQVRAPKPPRNANRLSVTQCPFVLQPPSGPRLGVRARRPREHHEPLARQHDHRDAHRQPGPPDEARAHHGRCVVLVVQRCAVPLLTVVSPSPLTRAQRWTRSSRASPCPRLCTTQRRRALPR